MSGNKLKTFCVPNLTCFEEKTVSEAAMEVKGAYDGVGGSVSPLGTGRPS